MILKVHYSNHVRYQMNVYGLKFVLLFCAHENHFHACLLYIVWISYKVSLEYFIVASNRRYPNAAAVGAV